MLTGDEYIALLEKRRDERLASNPTPAGRWTPPPLLEWFIRSGDEDLFSPPPAPPQPKRETTPRTYRPASHWRRLRDEAQAELDALTRPAAYDPGAVNLSHTARSRAARAAGRRRMVALDRDVRRAAELAERVARFDDKTRRAEAREAQTAHPKEAPDGR